MRSSNILSNFISQAAEPATVETKKGGKTLASGRRTAGQQNIIDYVRDNEAPSVARIGRPKRGEKYSTWDESLSYTTTFCFNADNYIRLTEIAYAQRLSRKECLDRLLVYAMDALEKDPSIINGK